MRRWAVGERSAVRAGRCETSVASRNAMAIDIKPVTQPHRATEQHGVLFRRTTAAGEREWGAVGSDPTAMGEANRHAVQTAVASKTPATRKAQEHAGNERSSLKPCAGGGGRQAVVIVEFEVV